MDLHGDSMARAPSGAMVVSHVATASGVSERAVLLVIAALLINQVVMLALGCCIAHWVGARASRTTATATAPAQAKATPPPPHYGFGFGPAAAVAAAAASVSPPRPSPPPPAFCPRCNFDDATASASAPPRPEVHYGFGLGFGPAAAVDDEVQLLLTTKTPTGYTKVHTSSSCSTVVRDGVALTLGHCKECAKRMAKYMKKRN